MSTGCGNTDSGLKRRYMCSLAGPGFPNEPAVSTYCTHVQFDVDQWHDITIVPILVKL